MFYIINVGGNTDDLLTYSLLAELAGVYSYVARTEV